MKLRTKLLIDFTLLFFVLMNLFGLALIKMMFYTSLHNSIDNEFTEYNVIYSDLKAGENMNTALFDAQDIITLKCKTYLTNSGSTAADLEVLDMERNIIYSSLSPNNYFDEALYQFSDEDQSNYVVARDEQAHYLFINQQITFRDNRYFLTYRWNIEHIYAEQSQYLLLLLAFNVVGGMLSVLTIYLFTRMITQSLQQLVENIEGIIRRNYDTELEKMGNITELNLLTDSFNTMSREISSQVSALELSNQQKQRFIDSLTHEIRTPLTSIIGYASLFLHQDTLSEPAVRKAFQNIHSNGKRIEQLTENLIKLITLDKTPLDLKPVSVRNILSNIQETQQERLIQEKVSLTIAGADFTVVSDAYLLEMLFSNFIDNAIKAVSGRDERSIRLELSEHSVRIQDTGKGMLPEDLEKIFEPFYMADKSRKRSYSGFGLGLAICHSIMELLHIGFDIQSQVDVGTTITLTFEGGQQ